MALNEDELARDEETSRRLMKDAARLAAFQGLGGAILSPTGAAGAGALGAVSAAFGGLFGSRTDRARDAGERLKPKAEKRDRDGATSRADSSSKGQSRPRSDRLAALTDDLTLGEMAVAATGALFGAAALGAAAYGVSKSLKPKIKIKPKSDKDSHLDVGGGRAGQAVVEKLEAALVPGFQTWIHLEKDSNTSLKDVLKLQALEIEVLLDRLLLADTKSIQNDLLNSLNGGKKRFARDHLEQVYHGKRERTLVTLEAQALAFRRALSAGSKPVVKWVNEHYHQLVRPAPGTIRGFVNDLRDKTIVHFIEKVRRDFRNPVVHGRMTEDVTPEAYKAWCDLVYGTASVEQWWTVGVDPKVHKPGHLGGLNLLMLARRV